MTEVAPRLKNQTMRPAGYFERKARRVRLAAEASLLQCSKFLTNGSKHTM